MAKKISSKQLASDYSKIESVENRFGDYDRINLDKYDAFLAGWAARGKADQEIVLEYDNQGSLTEVYNGIGTLDEQD